METPKQTTQRPCWCGNKQLESFSSDYHLCQACGTLVSQVGLAPDSYLVQDDESDFYGKKYWLDHMADELGLPRIQERIRLDLPERCCYWLRHLLEFSLPPARVLELGAAHGAYVALMRWAGYDASGLELSPWVADLAKRTFQVPMLVGPIEKQALPQSSFDVIVANDVVEHLPDPLTTLRAAIQLLKPDGILMIQMPEFVEGKSHAERVAAGEHFLEMTKVPEEHLYLYSRRSARKLLELLGVPHVDFCKPIFDYDMYFIASRYSLLRHAAPEAARCLEADPQGRLVQALLDKNQAFERLTQLWKESEADRAARLVAIEDLGRNLVIANDDRAARLRIMERQAEIIRQHEATISDLQANIGDLQTTIGDLQDTMSDLQDTMSFLQSPYFDGVPVDWNKTGAPTAYKVALKKIGRLPLSERAEECEKGTDPHY